MPNKDSFTFSDKLKKSKSLPLSKRIPSRVGGDGKAKRTLIQRAQRDLPFIIVAAAALLLLPLLSRNSGTEGPGGDNLGYDNFIGDSYDYPASGDSDIVPTTGYRNPMDYIITNKSGRDTNLADSYDSDDTSSVIGNAANQYHSQQPNISAYKDNAKKSIRNAIQRKATATGALRNRAMSFNAASAGLQRNLAIGGAPTTTGAAAAARAGIRPVALQPLSSAGGGRVLTGEGLYAEAARSLGALNQGSAKQALFDAQLRDVDGSPLGAAGDPRKAAARIGSQGTVPDSRFSYTNQKPWWWDMMNERSQKMWELWNYNWQKALSDSLIKVSTNLAMCLLTGSENGSVKNFLGVKGGGKDVCCQIKGEEICAGDIGDYTSSSSGSGDNKETSNNSFSAITTFCKDNNAETYISVAGKKNALQARMECLGLKTGKLSWMSKTTYAANCDGVNQPDLTYTVSATRKDGKTRQGKQDKMVIYVLAQMRGADNKGYGTPFVIKLNEAANNKLVLGKDKIKEINQHCVITNVGSFKSTMDQSELNSTLSAGNDYKTKNAGINSLNNTEKVNELNAKITKAKTELATIEKNKQERLKALGMPAISTSYNDDNLHTAKVQEIEGYQRELAPLADSQKAYDNRKALLVDEVNMSEYQARAQAAYDYCVNGSGTPNWITRADLVNALGGKKEAISQIAGNECVVHDFQNVFEKLTVNQNAQIDCMGVKNGVNVVAQQTTFSAKISGVGKNNVYALVVESGGNKAGEGGEKSGVYLRSIVPFTAEQNANYKNGDIYTTPRRLLGEQSVTIGTDGKDSANPGYGKIFWVVTPVKIDTSVANKFVAEKWPENMSVKDVIGIGGAYSTEVCDYAWGCNASHCPANTEPPAPDTTEYCAAQTDGEWNLYESLIIPSGDEKIYIQKSETPIDAEKRDNFLSSKGVTDTRCSDCIGTAVEQKKIFKCQPICKKKLEEIYKRNGKDAVGSPIAFKNLNLPDIDAVINNDALCPDCTPTPEEIANQCNFKVSLNYATSRFSPKDDNKYREMKAEFVKCLDQLSGNDSQGAQLYVTGFTSWAGSDGSCPTYDPANPLRNPEVSGPGPADGTVLMTNGSYRNSNSGDNPSYKCNKALSEDRAIFALHKMIEDLGADSSEKVTKILSSVNVSVNSKHDDTYVGFDSTKSAERSAGIVVDAYNRYKNRQDSKKLGSGMIPVIINTEGCGPEGYSVKSDYDDDRVIYFTQSNNSCNRQAYKDATSNK